MGCFTPCFGQWKHKQTMKKASHKSLSPSHELDEAVKLLPANNAEQEEIVNPTEIASKATNEEEQMNSSCKGKKSINSNVDAGDNGRGSDNLVENENGKAENKTGKAIDNELKTTSLTVYPANHGHQDLLIIDKECEDAVSSKEMITSEDNSEGGGIWDYCPVQPESSESLFSLSIDSRKQLYSAAEMGDKEVSSPLKPVDKENTPTKPVHFLVKSSLKFDEDDENKENANMEGKWIVPFSKEPVLMKATTDEPKKSRSNEIVVDTSLSSWLVESDKLLPHGTTAGNSPESEKNYRDRRILGAITPPAELRQLKGGCSSAGSTPCCSADDQPGVGTVGRYWKQRGLVSR